MWADPAVCWRCTTVEQAMRWTVVVAAALVGTSCAVVGLLSADAQQLSAADMQASAAGDDAVTGADRSVGMHHMAGWLRARSRAQDDAGPFDLIYAAPDRALTQADVQMIAQAYLLWHGNHDWQVVNVATDSDSVTFAIATGQKAVVATFAMDRHTGAVVRTG